MGLLSQGLFAFCMITFVAAQYTPETPRTVSYAKFSSIYGINTSAPSIAPSIPLTDPKVAPGPDADIPEQIHLFYHSSSEILVSWFTGLPQLTNDSDVPFTPPNTNALASEVSITQMGTSIKRIYFSGTAESYRMTYNFGPKGPVYPPYFNLTTYWNYTSGVIHRVLITGLKPSTEYRYIVGDLALKKISPVLKFKTLPATGTPTAPVYSFKPVTIAFIADIGISINASDTIRKIVGNKPDLVAFVGDYSYANVHNDNGGVGYYVTESAQYSAGKRWDALGRLLQPLLSSVPFLGCQGNHEREKQAGGNNFIPWTMRYGSNLPAYITGGSPFYYSTNIGPVHFISISPYVPYGNGSAQYAWLKADLAHIDKALTPWTVVIFHAPWYVTNVAHYQEAECHRIAIEPLLYNAGVDFVVNGHTHSYERSNKVYDYKINECGTSHIILGNAGIGLNPVYADSESYAPTIATAANTTYNASGPCPLPYAPSQIYIWLDNPNNTVCKHNFDNGDFCPSKQPDYSAMREASYGYGSIMFQNATHAKFSYYRNADAGKTAADESWIVKSSKC